MKEVLSYKWPTDFQEIMLKRISKEDEKKVFEYGDKITECDKRWPAKLGLKHNASNHNKWLKNQKKKEYYWKKIQAILNKYREDK